MEVPNQSGEVGVTEIIDFFAKRKEKKCQTDKWRNGISSAGIAKTPSMPKTESNAPTAELASFLTRKATRNWKKRESNHEPIAQIRLVLS